ncbi:recombinase family protein [Weissella cibaria]
MTIYGYARVSSQGQDFDGQIVQLKQYGATKVYSEKFTGTTANRPALKRLLRVIDEGDVLVITKLDRLARSVREGIKVIDRLTEKGIKVHVLNFGMLDDSPAGHLLRNIMLTFAEFERDMIVERLAEGRARAKSNNPNYKEGRPKRKLTKKHREAVRMLDELSYRETARLTGLSTATLWRIKKQMTEEREVGDYLTPLISLQHSDMLAVLIVVSILDIILGYAKAFTLKIVDSSVGTAGILKHILMVSVPLLIYPLFFLGNALAAWNAFVVSIIASNAVSAMENWVQMGLPFPDGFKQYLRNNKKKLQQSLESQEKKDNE